MILSATFSFAPSLNGTERNIDSKGGPRWGGHRIINYEKPRYNTDLKEKGMLKDLKEECGTTGKTHNRPYIPKPRE